MIKQGVVIINHLTSQGFLELFLFALDVLVALFDAIPKRFSIAYKKTLLRWTMFAVAPLLPSPVLSVC